MACAVVDPSTSAPSATQHLACADKDILVRGPDKPVLPVVDVKQITDFADSYSAVSLDTDAGSVDPKAGSKEVILRETVVALERQRKEALDDLRVQKLQNKSLQATLNTTVRCSESHRKDEEEDRKRAIEEAVKAKQDMLELSQKQNDALALLIKVFPGMDDLPTVRSPDLHTLFSQSKELGGLILVEEAKTLCAAALKELREQKTASGAEPMTRLEQMQKGVHESLVAAEATARQREEHGVVGYAGSAQFCGCSAGVLRNSLAIFVRRARRCRSPGRSGRSVATRGPCCWVGSSRQSPQHEPAA